MPVAPIETLLAFKAVALMPGLSAGEKRVAGAIIEHFNRASGRCDPGVGRLAGLLGLDRTTVLRAISSLHRRGIIVRTPHGGRSQRNSYEPNWEFLSGFNSAWNARFIGDGRAGRAAAKAPPSKSQSVDPTGGGTATQTDFLNLHKEPDAVEATELARRRSYGDAVGRQARTTRQLPAPTPSRRRQGSRQAAEAAATRRWSADLLERLRDQPNAYALAVRRIGADLQAAATATEMRQRGTGVELILKQLSIGATGPSRGPSSAGDSAPDETPVRACVFEVNAVNSGER